MPGSAHVGGDGARLPGARKVFNLPRDRDGEAFGMWTALLGFNKQSDRGRRELLGEGQPRTNVV